MLGWTLILIAACGGTEPGVTPDAGTSADAMTPRDAGPRDASTRSYSCSAPDWTDADWLAHSGCFYVVDVKDAFFNHWCWLSGACAPGTVPADSSIEQELTNHDELAALVSLQGIVNRTRPTL